MATKSWDHYSRAETDRLATLHLHDGEASVSSTGQGRSNDQGGGSNYGNGSSYSSGAEASRTAGGFALAFSPPGSGFGFDEGGSDRTGNAVTPIAFQLRSTLPEVCSGL